MRFNHKGNEYELAELTEPNKNETFDIIVILRVHYCIWVGTDLVEVDKAKYDANEDNFEKLEMVDYFYGADDEDDALIEVAKERLEEVFKNGASS